MRPERQHQKRLKSGCPIVDQSGVIPIWKNGERRPQPGKRAPLDKLSKFPTRSSPSADFRAEAIVQLTKQP